MKLISIKKAKELFLEGDEIWFLSGHIEEFDEDLDIYFDRFEEFTNGGYLEELTGSIPYMTVLSMDTQGDEEDDFNDNTQYFIEDEWHYMVKSNYCYEFMKSYESGALDRFAEFALELSEPIFFEGSDLKEGYSEIHISSAIELINNGIRFIEQ